MYITGASLIRNENSMNRQEILDNRIKAIGVRGGEKKMMTFYDMDAQTFISHMRRRFLKLVMNSFKTPHKEIEKEREN